MPIRETFAVLYQAGPSPPVEGIYKPMKPGGYRDSSADIAFALRQRGERVVTPDPAADAEQDEGWSFPDTVEGVAQAVAAGATVLWANTVLYEKHPVQTALRQGLAVVGQSPERVERFDDKDRTNRLLAEEGLPVPASVLAAFSPAERVLGLAELTEDVLAAAGVGLPAVVKPIRGRGSEGVTRVDSLAALRAAATGLLEQTSLHDATRYPSYGDAVIVEEYLEGEESTVAVLPPGVYRIGATERHFARPWALPAVRRTGHHDGIAPYSGTVAVIQNSEPMPAERLADSDVRELMSHCEKAAELIGARAPIRIDCRAGRPGRWRLFDVNLKPNMTGPGRPGRDDQASLVAIAAAAMGWDYPELIENVARQHWRRA